MSRLPRRRPVRRGQLITPFGVGAMNDFRNDEALMCAGLGLTPRSSFGKSASMLALPGSRDRGGGLPNDRVLALALGPDGALWVGTESGMSRLDEDRSPASGPVRVQPVSERGKKDCCGWNPDRLKSQQNCDPLFL